jgi:hypothetical protein
MVKDTVITVRLPLSVKRLLEERARKEHRSLSAQVLHELGQVLASAPARRSRSRGKLLGRYAGYGVPSEKDFAEVRAALWGRLPRVPGRG